MGGDGQYRVQAFSAFVMKGRGQMKGVILISHGKMAEGMLDSARLFMGDEIPQLEALCLLEGESPDEFREKLEQLIRETDTGDGVIVLADLYGGTPSNQAMAFLSDEFDLIAGANFSLLLQVLTERDNKTFDVDSLRDAACNAMVNVKAAMQAAVPQEDDDSWLS